MVDRLSRAPVGLSHAYGRSLNWRTEIDSFYICWYEVDLLSSSGIGQWRALGDLLYLMVMEEFRNNLFYYIDVIKDQAQSSVKVLQDT